MLLDFPQIQNKLLARMGHIHMPPSVKWELQAKFYHVAPHAAPQTSKMATASLLCFRSNEVSEFFSDDAARAISTENMVMVISSFCRSSLSQSRI